MMTSLETALAADASARSAVRFFWSWLAAAAGASGVGNVAHAIMHAPNDSAIMAAVAAVVPPAVLLGSTHSVALLVKARRAGLTYWCALAMTIGLAVCAFVLSFDALRDLATTLGMPPDRAWLWPCVIDVSIAQSTLALLSLNGPLTSAGRSAGGNGIGRLVVPADDVVAITEDAPQHAAPVSPSPIGPNQWRPAAQQLVRAGITQKDAEVVAQVLAEHAAGTPPTTIGKMLDVHHSTVSRILAGANQLAG